MNIEDENAGAYGVEMESTAEMESTVIKAALTILDSRTNKNDLIEGSEDIKNYLRLKLAHEESEVFGAVMLTTKHRVIKIEELFRGTIDTASVYPREFIKAILACNASRVILYHNHPSGSPEPSRSDIAITAKLKKAAECIDVTILDHLIVGDSVLSMTEQGIAL